MKHFKNYSNNSTTNTTNTANTGNAVPNRNEETKKPETSNSASNSDHGTRKISIGLEELAQILSLREGKTVSKEKALISYEANRRLRSRVVVTVYRYGRNNEPDKITEDFELAKVLATREGRLSAPGEDRAYKDGLGKLTVFTDDEVKAYFRKNSKSG